MVNPNEALRENLDRQLLERNSPPSHALAREQLTKAGIKFKTDHPGAPGGIVRADPDAIVFVNEHGTVITAWSETRPTGATVFYCEAGMSAWPSA